MYHKTVKEIEALFLEKGFPFESFEHVPVVTSEDAAAIHSAFSLHQGTKALIVRVTTEDKLKKFVMLVVPGDRKFDSAKLKTALGFSSPRFATPEEVASITDGVERGGVPPFGNLFGLEVYMDTEVTENEIVIFNAGDRGYSIATKSAHLVELVHPHICSIV